MKRLPNEYVSIILAEQLVCWLMLLSSRDLHIPPRSHLLMQDHSFFSTSTNPPCISLCWTDLDSSTEEKAVAVTSTILVIWKLRPTFGTALRLILIERNE